MPELPGDVFRMGGDIANVLELNKHEGAATVSLDSIKAVQEEAEGILKRMAMPSGLLKRLTPRKACHSIEQ